MYEQTIRAAAACSGIGLHSGAPVSMRILPAPSGTGIVFRRTDLDGFEIEAAQFLSVDLDHAAATLPA